MTPYEPLGWPGGRDPDGGGSRREVTAGARLCFMWVVRQTAEAGYFAVPAKNVDRDRVIPYEVTLEIVSVSDRKAESLVAVARSLAGEHIYGQPFATDVASIYRNGLSTLIPIARLV